MFHVKCTFSDLSEVINNEYLPCAVYIDLKKASLETYDNDEAAKKDALIRLPYQERLYAENSALHDYIQEMGISIPYGMSARQYLLQNESLFDFYDFYNAEVKLRLTEWFNERGFAIVFNA